MGSHWDGVSSSLYSRLAAFVITLVQPNDVKMWSGTLTNTLISKGAEDEAVLYLHLLSCRESADKVVLHTGKYEELIVCSHEIAASTAQLVAASKVMG